MQNFFFHHSLLIGDLIYALPGIQQVSRSYRNQFAPSGDPFSGKAVIQLHLNQVWPMADAIMRRNGITLTEDDFNNMSPLLMAQDYIADVVRYQDDMPFHINLDDVMGKYGDDLNIPYGCISRWWSMVWPDMACDLSKRWLIAGEEPETKGMIVLNRSARSHNPNINYSFLKKYQSQIIFLGLEDEWMSFQKVFDLSVTHYKIRDFYHMACVINSAKFFIGNQSFPFALAEGLKVPRMLEIYYTLPHVIPTGENAFDFCYTDAAKFYVERFIRK